MADVATTDPAETRVEVDERMAPDPVAAWAADLEHLLGELRGGTARKLLNLAENIPAGPGVWPALTAAARGLEFTAAADWPAAAGAAAEALARPGPGAARAAAHTLVRNLLLAAGRALDAGGNDPADPAARAADFGGRAWTVAAGPAPYAGPLFLAPVAALPAGHPFRALEPVDSPAGPAVVLGHPSRVLFRLSRARERTDAVRRHRACEEAERRRHREEAEGRRRREFEASPAGLRARVAELEAALAAKGGDR